MATRLPAIALSLALTGCAGTSADVMLGAKVGDGGFYGPTGPTITLRVRQRITDHTFCEASHTSHLTAGPPFGASHEEDSLNLLGCGVAFGMKRASDAD